MITLAVQNINSGVISKTRTDVGWAFKFRSADNGILCEKWSYTAGVVHSYIYTWDKVDKIQKKGVYVVNNNISVKRTSDGVSVPVKNISFGIDWNSYCYSASISVVGSDAVSLIAAQELEADINGHIFRFFVEQWNEQINFLGSEASASGRSLLSEMDEPTALKQAYLNNTDVSAKQQAETILENTGWTLDWQIDDWLIKANAFSVYDTPIRAITKIISAAGSLIYDDAQDKIIHIKPRYKVKTWNLSGATPDIVVPSSVLTTVSNSITKQPVYNGVYVIGTSKNGVAEFVKRAGTNGLPTAEQVAGDLITDTVVAINRGTAELCAKNGDYYTTTITMPVMLQLVSLGDILEINIKGNTIKAIATAVKIMAARDADGTIGAQQVVEVIRWQ